MLRPRKSKVLALPANVRWDDIEFFDAKAIEKEIAAFDAKARIKAAEFGRIIAADFERERQQLLAECLRKQAADRLEIAALEFEEKYQQAVEADRAEARRVFAAYIEKISAKFKAAAEEQREWQESGASVLKKIQADINRSAVHDERLKLLARGVVRGRRG